MDLRSGHRAEPEFSSQPLRRMSGIRSGTGSRREGSAEGLSRAQDVEVSRSTEVPREELRTVPPEIFQSMVEAMASAIRQAVESQPSSRSTRVLEEKDTVYGYLKSVGATPFEGTGTPDEAETWMRELEIAFRIARLTEQQKVEYVICFLRKDALDWWETQEALMGGVESVSWEEFKKAFHSHYLPESYQSKKISEFFALRQDKKTVEEYDRSFRSLLRYVPNMMGNEVLMKERFYENLNRDVKLIITGPKWATYHELVEAAIAAERALGTSSKTEKGEGSGKRSREGEGFEKSTKRFSDEVSRGRSSFRPDFNRSGFQNFGRPFVPFGKRPEFSASGSSATGPRRGGSQGFSVGGSGRSRGSIEGVTCYACGKVGHYARNCPALGKADSTNLLPSRTRSGKRGSVGPKASAIQQERSGTLGQSGGRGGDQ